jgi:hypothetical protein
VAYFGGLVPWLQDLRFAMNISNSTAVLFIKVARRIQKSRAVQSLREAIELVETARYLGMTLDRQLNWSAHFSQVGKAAAQILGVLGPLLNSRSGLSVRNGVVLCKQLIRPVMDYACLICRSAARSHIRKLKFLQFTCLRISTNAPWCVINRQFHEDLWIPFFADHIWFFVLFLSFEANSRV